MTIQDPEAIWIMQGWMFSYGDFWQQPQIEAILSSVPSGRMIILDLDSTHNEQYTRTKSYYHLQPFIFNDLSNFGGGLGLFGRFDNINRRPFEARNMQNSTMIGKYLYSNSLKMFNKSNSCNSTLNFSCPLEFHENYLLENVSYNLPKSK